MLTNIEHMRTTLTDFLAVLAGITGLALTTLVLAACGTDDAATAHATGVRNSPVTVTLDAPPGDRDLGGCRPADPQADCG